MQRELIWPEGALDAWQVKDKAFMEQRKAEWEIIQQYLRLYKNVRSTNFRYHKQLFMKGRINYPDSFNFGVEPSLFYQMWYYPKNDLELFKEMFFLNLESTDRLEITSSRLQYVDWLRSQAAHGVSGKMCLPGYGLFGGKEENMFRALFPDYDINNKVKPNYNRGKVDKISLGPSLGLIIDHINSAYGSLYYGYRNNPFHPGFVIWDYLDFILKENDLFAADNKDYLHVRDSQKELFINIIDLTRYKKQKSKRFDDANPDVLEKADSLAYKFVKRQLCPNLLAIWDNVDSLYQEYCCYEDSYFQIKNSG